jgi:AmmeMemoRadiSam system protein B
VEADLAAYPAIADLPQVRQFEAPFEGEHCLEVQLPFLQVLLPQFRVVPLLVGDAETEEVAAVLDRLWGGDETLIVISSDLSHYFDYPTARRLDSETSRAIERLAPEEIGDDQACGRIPLKGLLATAKRRGLKALTLDLRNSGDTAGPRHQVVGYGAYALV